MESHAAFERNLARIRRRNAPSARLVETSADPEITVVEGPKGASTVSVGGKLLGSAYDPKAEGERLAGSWLKEETDILVAVGFGLGHHLEAFRKRNPCPILIYEPSPARLRAALETRPLPLLDEDDVWLTTELAPLGGLLSRYYVPGLSIRIAPHPALLDLEPAAVQDAVAQVRQTKNALDITAATRVEKSAGWAALTVENLPEWLPSPSAFALKNAFEGMPAVVCAAGPSLDAQLPLLREYQDRVLIVAIGQVVGSLRAAGIRPHAVHIVESQDVRHHLVDGEGKGSEDLDLFLLANVFPGLFELPVRTRYHVPIQADSVATWLRGFAGDARGMHSGGTVAQTAVFLARVLGADPVLLIGQDLAYTNQRAYAKGSSYDGVGFQEDGDGQYRLTRIDRKMRHFRKVKGPARTQPRELVWVPGWGGQRVATSPAYASFRETYRDIAASVERDGGRLINCTEGGALIPGVDHERFADMLERHAAPRPVAISERIAKVHAEHAGLERAPFEQGLDRLDRALDALERDAKAGLDCTEQALAALARRTSQQRQIDLLRGIGRCERRVQKGLAGVPWLDPLVQAALHEAIAESRRRSGATPTAELAAEESRTLFETTVEGIERAREMRARIGERLERCLPEA